MLIKRSTCLTIDDRATIIEKLEHGHKACVLADEYGVTQSAISEMKRNKENILKPKQILEECGATMKRVKYTGIESSLSKQQLFTWLKQT